MRSFTEVGEIVSLDVAGHHVDVLQDRIVQAGLAGPGGARLLLQQTAGEVDGGNAGDISRTNILF